MSNPFNPQLARISAAFIRDTQEYLKMGKPIELKKEDECEDCVEAQKEGYTMCGECSVPCCWAHSQGALDTKEPCPEIADNE